jgi:hypothetical protein
MLAPHGSIAVELGDTYAGSGGAGGDYSDGGMRAGQNAFEGTAAKHRASGRRPQRKPRTSSARILGGDPDEATVAAPPDRLRTRRQLPGWPMAKSICGIPHLYALSLAYGVNLLTGEESPAGFWRVRNQVAWCRPNPAPGAVGDKFKPATSYMTVATLASDRYWDGFAVREPASPNTNARTAKGVQSKPNTTKSGDDPRTGGNRSTLATIYSSGDTRPPYDWWDVDTFEPDAWEIATRPYLGAHFAVWPPALLERPMLAMVPHRVCTECGQPSRRIVEGQRCLDGEPVDEAPALGDEKARREQIGEPGNWRWSTELTEKGWTDCGHDSWRNGVVLDPFAGSGTTLAVATGHGRDCIGIDLDARNADLARERVGMFLEVEYPAAEVPA